MEDILSKESERMSIEDFHLLMDSMQKEIDENIEETFDTIERINILISRIR